MDQPGLVEKTQTVEQLLRKDPHERRAQSTKLVLLDQLVEVHT